MKTSKNNSYIVVGSKPWNKQAFDEVISRYPGEWHFMGQAQELTLASIQRLNPRALFFLHWSLKIPQEIIDKYECINFHMTNLPFGRGGSPLQNLIAKGLRKTTLSAHKMTSEIDAGPIYAKEPMSLEGNAGEIYVRSSFLAARMIKHIIANNFTTTPQKGIVVIFKRRKPEQSEVKEAKNLQEIFDYIRMLDAPDYPHAFIQYQGFRLEFSRASFVGDRLECDVTITKHESHT